MLEPELVQLLREHKRAAEWRKPADFVFAGRIREQPRERNNVRTRILYAAANGPTSGLPPKTGRRSQMA